MNTLVALLNKDGSVKEYPVSLKRLKKLFPTIGWTDPPKASTLARVEGVIVAPTAQPALQEGETIAEGTPALDKGQWKQVWTVLPPTPEKVAQIKAALVAEAEDVAKDKLLTRLVNSQDNLASPQVAAIRTKLADIKTGSAARTLAQARTALDEMKAL